MLLLFACASEPDVPPVEELDAAVEAVPEEAVEEPVEPEAEEPAIELDEVVDEPAVVAVEDEPAVEAPVVEEPIEDDVVEDEEVEDEAVEEEVEEPVGTWTYWLTPKSSRVRVVVLKDPDTIGASASHDHVVSASGWSGTATWNPCHVELRVPVKKFVVDHPSHREAAGLDGELSEGQRGDVKSNMLAKDQLDAASHPTITFVSTSCTATSVTGDLTIHGVTKSVTTPWSTDIRAEAFSATGSLKAKQSDFGIEPFSAMMGALRNQDGLAFSFHLEGDPS